MHDRAWRVFGAASFSLIFGACAGGDTPATNAALREQIEERYVDGVVGSAGGSGSGGRGGAAGTNGDGGRAGSSPSSAGSSGASGGVCDGFTVLADNCGSSGCHGQGSQFSNFAESESAALSFVGESGEALCASEGPLIDPENPAASIILQKVTADVPPCGDPMPVVGELSQADITCLQEWIRSL